MNSPITIGAELSPCPAWKRAVIPNEEIANGTGPKPIAQTASAMFARVMAHVTGLAQRRQIARPVVAGIVIEMRAGQDHAGPAERLRRCDARQAGLRMDHRGGAGQAPHPPAPPVAPARGAIVPPGPVAEMDDVVAMRSPAMLAPSLGSAEPDQRGEFAPVDRIEPAMFARDRHGPM